jgi:hypothetical protein
MTRIVHRHILEKAFDSKRPDEDLGETIHLCCCLSCPLAKGRTGTKSTCILCVAQHWPNQTANLQQSIIHHWYDIYDKIKPGQTTPSSKKTTIFLHGLGRDLTTGLMTEDYTTAFEQLSCDDDREKFIETCLKSRAVIKITFGDLEEWECSDNADSTCVSFHRLVSVQMFEPSIVCRHCLPNCMAGGALQ